MKTYSLRIPLPKRAYSIKLNVQAMTSPESKEKSHVDLSRYHLPEVKHEHCDLNKVHAINMVQTWF